MSVIQQRVVYYPTAQAPALPLATNIGWLSVDQPVRRRAAVAVLALLAAETFVLLPPATPTSVQPSLAEAPLTRKSRPALPDAAAALVSVPGADPVVLLSTDAPVGPRRSKVVDREEARPPAIAAGEFLVSYVPQWQPQDKDPQRPPISKLMLLEPGWPPAIAAGEFLASFLPQWQHQQEGAQKQVQRRLPSDGEAGAQFIAPVSWGWHDPSIPFARVGRRAIDADEARPSFLARQIGVALVDDSQPRLSRRVVVDREEARPPAIASGEFLLSYVPQWQPQTTDPQRPPISRLMLLEPAWPVAIAPGQFLPSYLPQWQHQQDAVGPRRALRLPDAEARALPVASIAWGWEPAPQAAIIARVRLGSLEIAPPLTAPAAAVVATTWAALDEGNAPRRRLGLISDADARPPSGASVPSLVSQWWQPEAPAARQKAKLVDAGDARQTPPPLIQPFVDQPQSSPAARRRIALVDAEPLPPIVRVAQPFVAEPEPLSRNRRRMRIVDGVPAYVPPFTQQQSLPPFFQNEEASVRRAYRKALLNSTAVGPILVLQSENARPAGLSVVTLPRNRAALALLLPRNRPALRVVLSRNRQAFLGVLPTRS